MGYGFLKLHSKGHRHLYKLVFQGEVSPCVIKTKYKCENCNSEYTESYEQHSWEENTVWYGENQSYHYRGRTCTGCNRHDTGARSEPHIWNSSGTECTVCGFVR